MCENKKYKTLKTHLYKITNFRLYYMALSSIYKISHNIYNIYIYIYICLYNLSRRVLSEAEISVLEKGLDFAPVQNKINEPELRRDFEQFCRHMRIKQHFRNEPTQDFSNTPAFTPKSSLNPSKSHPNIEVFLSQIEHELFHVSDKSLPYSNLLKEEWQAVRSLANDRQIVIKKADKGSCIVVWDRDDYLLEAEKQLGDTSIYKDVSFSDKLLTNLEEN